MSFDHPEVRAVEGRAAGFQQGIARRLRQFCRVGSMALALCTASFGATVALANPSLGKQSLPHGRAMPARSTSRA